MELRFKVNQAEAFRRGVSVPKSVVRVLVDPAELSQEARDMIADRMDGIDVCKGRYDEKQERVVPQGDWNSIEQKWSPEHIEANADTVEALLEAVGKDHARVVADGLLPAPK